MSEDTPRTQFGHEHRFIFLRTEKVPSARWGDRITEWAHYDLFYCEGCLDYQRVLTMKTRPGQDSFDPEVTWRKA